MTVERVQMAHGSGGRLMHQLIRDHFASSFALPSLNDSAVMPPAGTSRIAVTTDSYVITPYFFPGGDIGTLSVCGTVNDLAMAGARPLYLTAGFIIEEGMPLHDLERIVLSMKETADRCGIRIVAGDTKVVEKGKGDGIYINTAGFGILDHAYEFGPQRIAPGDRILISGSIGNHGMAVMAERSGITFSPPLLSDVAPLHALVQRILGYGPHIRVLRDPTRGGVATTLKEFASESGCCMMITEDALQVRPAVRGACDLLGLDPLYVANEGILIVVVASEAAEDILGAMRFDENARDCASIGEVAAEPPGRVLLQTTSGGIRIIDMLTGEQLPRIC